MDWESRLQQLRVFKAKYGHCNVPQQIKMNGKGRVGTCSLGTWVTMSPSPAPSPPPSPLPLCLPACLPVSVSVSVSVGVGVGVGESV
jgi:hypothetical protein